MPATRVRLLGSGRRQDLLEWYQFVLCPRRQVGVRRITLAAPVLDTINEGEISMGRNSAIAVTVSVLSLSAVFAADHDKNHNDAFVPGQAGETRIVREVRHQLLMLPYYGIFDDLAFSVTGSTVTLVGQVTRPTLKSDAQNVIKRVEGVTEVVNNVEVLPLSPMDDQIRAAEYRAIYGDPSLSTRYGFRALPSIHIIVRNGQVTLEGVVANEADKNLVNIRANSVPNVFSVKNELQVEG
jgi:hyperosmotically inducible protein